MRNIVWIDKRYPVDSIQIYFAASLELQEELTNYGFRIPRSIDGKIETPIPIIYGDFKGWIKQREPITIERLIPPEWLGLKLQDLGWEETGYKGRRAFHIPAEEVYVDIGYDGEGNIYLKLDAKGYHLERVSIRGVNPEKWNNWAMFYINAKYYDELLNLLKDLVGASSVPISTIQVGREVLQGGKEITFYAYTPKRKDVGIPITGFSLCLGCFSLALAYFKAKSRENGVSPDVMDRVRLRLDYDPSIKTGLKVGVAKIIGKSPQIMFKLASNTPKQIRGILKDFVKGKARGRLSYCDHRDKTQLIVINGRLLYTALSTAKQYLSRLPSDDDHARMLEKSRK
ncbi:hypothetical protein ATG_03660 [Desulfurococcaceae archaeon AG1]|jgi:hypothetical protein|nr:MAG: PhoI [Desulfurococcaceae archaeon]GAY25163.1 hypothetical protein ATG_03660 [Desulfurococcaceae archaeon AG1]